MLGTANGLSLTENDFLGLDRRYINRNTAQAANLRRVDSLDGRDTVGRKGAGDYAGIAIDYRRPGSPDVLLTRLRLDHPAVGLNGKSDGKYLTAPGTRNRVYFPPYDSSILADIGIPVLFTEGEFKALAGYRVGLEDLNNGGQRLRFVSLGLPGVWGYRGIIGKTTNARGERIDVKGVIPDIESYIPWEGRLAYICYDVNVLSNAMVREARAGLARELEERGATVYFIDLPPSPGVNGMDDFIAIHGRDEFLKLFGAALRYNWRDELARSDKGKVLPTFNNALTALRLAPPWRGVIAYNEFALAAEARKETPWGGPPGRWSDDSDLRTTEWLEHHGIAVSDIIAGKAAATVAREHTYHPVRAYLDGLKWDGVSRIDDWLVLYLGCEQNEYIRAIGARWLISAVARIRQPGCKADCALVLESPQGAGKSTAFEILGGEFYSDDIADLSAKDAAMGTAGVWIMELAELAAMGRSEVEKVKAFLSRRIDRYRPPYARHYIWTPRQCVFGGSINLAKYLKDETGGRRFWPAKCGHMNLDALRRDRNLLWAEASARYEKSESWWLDTPELVADAAVEQEERLQSDPWEPLIAAWLLSQDAVTTADILERCIHKDTDQWTRADETRVGVILHNLEWESAERAPRSVSPTRRRLYRQKERK